MGLFDGIRIRRNASKFVMSPQRAILLVMLEGVFADNWESKEETLLLQQIMAKSPVYSENTDTDDIALLEQARHYRLNQPDALDRAVDYLPEELKETAFAMAGEIIFADGIVHEKEVKFIEGLAKKLNIPNSKAKAVITTFEMLYRALPTNIEGR